MIRRFFSLFSTLESRTYYIFTFLILITILSTQLISYYFTQSSITDATNTQKGYAMERLTYQIDSYMQTMESVAEAVISSDQVQEFFSGGLQKASLESYLASFLRAREDITTIALFGFDGRTATSTPGEDISPYVDVTAQQWYREAQQHPEKPYISSAHVQNLYFGEYPWVVSMSMTFRDRISGEPAGIILVDMNFNRIRELCQPIIQEPPEYIFILDEQGDYVYHPQQQLVFSGITSEPTAELMDPGANSPLEIDGKSYITRMTETSRWTVVCVTELQGNIAQWRYVQISYASIGLLAFIVVGLMANLLSRSITRPVKELSEVMQQADKNNFNITADIDSTDEIQQLADEFNIMVSKIRDLIEQIHNEQELKRKSELKALQAQINPHFLYNTLDSIIWMSEMERSDEVVEMTSALARLFRISISRGREIITVKDELMHVESYLIIQKMRYREHFSYSIEVDPSLLNSPCLKIVLQPLVENSIYHGLKTADYSGTIRITGERREEMIVLQVIDNGVGMDPVTFHKLIDPQQEGSNASSSGVGLHNVHERLKLYFGEEYGLECTVGETGDTVVGVRLPIQGTHLEESRR